MQRHNPSVVCLLAKNQIGLTIILSRLLFCLHRSWIDCSYARMIAFSRVNFHSLFIAICVMFVFAPSALSESAPLDDCNIERGSNSTIRKVGKWLNDSGSKSSGEIRAEISQAIAKDDVNCRDKIILNHAFHVARVRWGTNSEAEASAHFVLGQPYDFIPPLFGEYQEESTRRLIRLYKQSHQYDALIDLWQNPAAKETAYNPLRDAFVLATFANGSEAAVMDMIRPLAENEVGADDWWLMTFASALSERKGDEVLAQKFQNKADAIFTSPRPLLADQDLEGDRVTQMVQLATSPQSTGWQLASLPKVKYPNTALSRKQTGRCDVVFDISNDGRPETVRPYCTSDSFIRSSRAGVKRMRFQAITDQAEAHRGVVYSIWYRAERSAQIAGTELISGRVTLMPYLN
ncbi:MAG: energy transducer TonB [Pseudomonadota bacterium]